jgi:predicted methyltransferase
MKWIVTPVAGLALAGLIASAALARPPAAKDAAKDVANAVARAVADPGRADDARIDSRRHVAELVVFSEVKPGDRVLELIPGSGYFTRVFSKVVGPKGAVYAALPAEMEKGHPGAEKMRSLAKQGYGNIQVLVQPAAALAAPQPVDVVFTSQNYHDYPDKFMGPTDPALLDKAVFAALKPGGTYIVVDHAAETGSGLRVTETLHRIDPALVKTQVMDAGFEFAGESDVLRDPADNHKRKVFDPAIRGHTDQFVYKFRKPKSAK